MPAVYSISCTLRPSAGPRVSFSGKSWEGGRTCSRWPPTAGRGCDASSGDLLRVLQRGPWRITLGCAGSTDDAPYQRRVSFGARSALSLPSQGEWPRSFFPIPRTSVSRGWRYAVRGTDAAARGLVQSVVGNVCAALAGAVLAAFLHQPRNGATEVSPEHRIALHATCQMEYGEPMIIPSPRIMPRSHS